MKLLGASGGAGSGPLYAGVNTYMTSYSTATGALTTYTFYAGTFTATASSMTVYFGGQGESGGMHRYWGVDDVALEVAPNPTSQPTSSPTIDPTGQPSRQPTGQPTRQPICKEKAFIFN